MELSYYKWLECEVTHSYFEHGVASFFELLPLEQTARQMRNYNILMNKQHISFSLFTGIPSDQTFDIAGTSEGITDLYFQLVANDYEFFNYTNLEFTSEDTIYFFSNVNLRDGAPLLHSDAFASQSNLIAIRPHLFEYSPPEGATLLEVKTLDGITVLTQEILDGNGINFFLDLQFAEVGRYELWLDNGLYETFFLSNSALKPGCIGIVHIQMATLIESFDDGLKYAVNFETRSVHWRYKIAIAPNRNIQISEMSITGIQNENYLGPEVESLTAHQKVSVFTSDIPLPLKNKMEKSPVLKIKYNSEFSDEDTSELKLPNPGGGSISKNINEENEVTFSSTSIIYV